jgi:hypothetical protein
MGDYPMLQCEIFFINGNCEESRGGFWERLIMRLPEDMWPHKVRPGYKEIPFEVDYDLVPRLYPEPSIWQRL